MKPITNFHFRSRLKNPDYLGVASLYEGGVTEPNKLILTVKEIGTEVVPGQKGKKKDKEAEPAESLVIAFKETAEKLIVKATNAARIKQLYGPIMANWIGRRIVLHQEMEYNGLTKQNEEMLRVSIDPADYAGATLPEITPTYEKWQGMIEAIAAGKTTVTELRKRFTISAETETTINNAVTSAKNGNTTV